MHYLYKRNKGFNYSEFLPGDKPIPEEVKNITIEVNEEDYSKLLNHELMWNNGVLVPNPDFLTYQIRQETINKIEQYNNELRQIKKWFEANDWKVNKIVIGEWEKSDPRWLDYISERAIKRTRQDELHSLIEELGIFEK